MLLANDLAVHSGPPPQAVLNQRCLWHLLMVLLCVTFLLRLIGLDIAGAMLTGLMFGFALVMTRDGMSEMTKYCLVYAVLCSLNFFFDILPLLTELGGRVQRSTDPGVTQQVDGIAKTTITITVRTTPFFDQDQGMIYNSQSLSMVFSPICMALGAYLAITAHNEATGGDFWADDRVEDRLVPVRVPGNRVETERAQAGPSQRGGSSSTAGNGGGFQRFQGAPHKLSP